MAAAAAAAAPSLMMVAPIAFCKCFVVGSSPLSHPPLCPPGLLPRILSIFHISLYGRIYRFMRLIATRFCLFAKDKCNSHSNWTCTFMAFSFSSYSANPSPSLCLSRTRSHFLLCHSHVCGTQSHKKMPKKSVLLLSVYVFPPIFRRSVSRKKFTKYPSRGLSEGKEKQQGSNTLMEFVPGSLSRGLAIKKRKKERIYKCFQTKLR